MILLIPGILLWSAVHLFPALAARPRARLAARLGGPYRGLFALLVVVSLVLIVFGWRAAEPAVVYVEPSWGRAVNMALMLVALILFVSARMKTNIKRYIRHPQLTGVLIWAGGHLLANGDSRSVVLFGGLGLWAIAAIVAINRRDGAWQKPEPVPLARDLIPLAAGVVVYAVLGFLHPYFTGVAVH